MSERSQKALSEFVSEAQENIDALGRDLLRLDQGGEEPDPELLNAVFRAAHTLKGLSSMFGVERMSRLAHALEDMLDDVRMGRRALDSGAVDLLLEAPEVFTRILGEESEGRPPESTEAAVGLAERLRTGGPAAAAASQDPLDSLDLPAAVRGVLTEYEEHRLRSNVQKGMALQRVKVSYPLEAFDRELAALNARLKRHGEVVSTLPSADAADPQSIAFELLYASREPVATALREAGPGASVEPVALRGGARAPAAHPPRTALSPPPEPLPATRPAAAPGAEPAPAAEGSGAALSPLPEPGGGDAPSLRSASQSVRVDIHKLDRLMNAVGELVLIKSSLAEQVDRHKAQGGDPLVAGELQRLSRGLERKLAELQAGILEVRMVPLEQVFDKLARMVRKLAREVGKEIDFVVAGGDVELDKLIVEELSDPLMHLIRNSIDHGIEQPAARRRSGKPEVGRVKLAAAQQGNHVQIVVEDDGAGLDEERIRQVALERGLATAQALADLSRRELLNLIFTPGFSTARQVTALSGRGVGLDVVKTNIAELSGIIDLSTTRGLGTRFEITLPVTLAILRALVVAVAGRLYAIPLNSVLEILEVRADEVRTLSTREVISLRGATLPLLRLGSYFRLDGAGAPARFFVVVVGLAQERLGIAVDGLEGQQDIVVKTLGQKLSGVRGIAGATDLGSRRTVLVLDVGSIIEDVVAPEGIGEARRDGIGPMYLEFYGLARKPFSKTPDPEFLYRSRQHAEALARLSHALEEREVAVLTGEVGAGKTTLSRALVDAYAATCRFSFVVNPALPPAQLLSAVAEGFGLSPGRRKVDVFGALGDHAARLDAEGLLGVVIVDEAQLLPGRSTYDELRLLTNLAADDRPLLGILLIGQPELRERLARRGGEAFSQRVGVAYHLGPLDAGETGRYLAHRLAVAGRRAPLFDDGAVEAVQRLSGGVPRRINQLAAGALLEGFAREATTLSADVVEAAGADLAAHLGSARPAG